MERKPFVRERPETSGSGTPPCQGGCRGFDPRFPLQASLQTRRKLGAPPLRAGALLPRRVQERGQL